jgi:hypothetical protein
MESHRTFDAVFASNLPNLAWHRDTGRIMLASGRLELIVETKSGINARSLRDRESGQVHTDSDYVWPDAALPTIEKEPLLTQGPDGSRTIVLQGRLGSLEVKQVFTAPAAEPGVILEEITIRNGTQKAVAAADFKCGFAKRIREGTAWLPDAADIRCCPVPYRRETDGKMQEFPLREVAERASSFGGWMEKPHATPIWGAEGWVWSKAPASLLVAKYNPSNMEWSLMEPVQRGTTTVLRFGGAGQWKYGHPEAASRLEPGQSYRFGPTRIQAVAGDWQPAYYAYRRWLESKGCGVPKGYNPPVHWNELYDNEYFFKCCKLGDNYLGQGKPGFTPELYGKFKELLDQYYTLDLMKAEAAKAQELGCEVLYLDPGWDTFGKRGGLHVWDKDRLGPMDRFVAMIKKDYGLKGVSLWCSLAGAPPTFVDAKTYPAAQVLSKDGVKEPYLLCHPSAAFLDAKENLLLELCRNGALFLMFDSNQYSGPCYDKSHGHGIPSTREDHARATCELARRIKAKYPHVLIEMHDPITGPCGIHYTPSYYGYAPPTSFDCLWGHEFMWDPLKDLLSRKAVSLYYYNLAYSIPLYLHVSLKGDNAHALVFWWFASTCRHLGVGGKPADPAVWEAEKRAMRRYLPLKRFYTQGVFYGRDEMIHVHTLPDIQESVINIFNLEDKPVRRQVRFQLPAIGLRAGTVQVEGATAQQRGDNVTFELDVPAHGHQLARVRLLP